MIWIFLAFAALLAMGYTVNSRSVAGGVFERSLALCPQKSNCVCSQDPRPKYFIEPLSAKGSRPMERLQAIIEAMPGARIVVRRPNYLHAAFRSQVFQFVDDVEFFYIPEEQKIHVRSVSRLGYYDFGVNRNRIEKIRKNFFNSLLSKS